MPLLTNAPSITMLACSIDVALSAPSWNAPTGGVPMEKWPVFSSPSNFQPEPEVVLTSMGLLTPRLPKPSQVCFSMGAKVSSVDP